MTPENFDDICDDCGYPRNYHGLVEENGTLVEKDFICNKFKQKIK